MKRGKSDGVNEERLQRVVACMHKLTDAQIDEVLVYFSTLKENGRERFDDCTHQTIWLFGAEFLRQGKEPPAIVKQYLLIRLKQRPWAKKERKGEEKQELLFLYEPD